MIHQAVRRFSSSLRLPLFLHMDRSSQKKYIVSQSTTLAELQVMFRDSDPVLEKTDFYMRDAQDQRTLLTDLAQVTLLKDCVFQSRQTDMLEITVDGKVFDFSMDKDQLAYYLESPLDGVMQGLQMPHNESVVINQLNKQIMATLGDSSLSVQQVSQAVDTAVASLNRSNSEQEQHYSRFLESAMEQLRRLESQLGQVESESVHKGYQVLKFLILATIAQWLILFYLTYTGYGWDFCEPIAYLIGLATETAVLLFFIKSRGALGQSSIFSHYFRKQRKMLIQEKGTSLEAAIGFQKHKIAIVQSRNYFLKQ